MNHIQNISSCQGTISPVQLNTTFNPLAFIIYSFDVFLAFRNLFLPYHYLLDFTAATYREPSSFPLRMSSHAFADQSKLSIGIGVYGIFDCH